MTARREARRGRQAERPPYRAILSPAIIAFLVVGFTSHLSMGAFEVVWSIWLDHLGASMTYISLTWIAFSVPMLLAFAGGMLADRYSRFALMFAGYAISGVAWILYGTTTNLVLFLAVNVVEGLAIAFSYPAKQAFLVQVSPQKWLGTVTGLETTSMQLAGMIGTLPRAGGLRLDLRVRDGDRGRPQSRRARRRRPGAAPGVAARQRRGAGAAR